MERNQTVVGRWPEGIRQRHVERHRLCHEFALRCDDSAADSGLLQGGEKLQSSY